MFARVIEFGGIEPNAILTIVIWMLLSILTIYAAIVCVGVFKSHCINANRAWKKHCCRVWMAFAITLPALSILKTIELARLAISG